MTVLPVVFVWDVDRTMIGKITNELAKNNLRSFINTAFKVGKVPRKIKLCSTRDVMSPNMLRPGLKDAFAAIKKLFPTAEFFVYSAGTSDYVRAIVPWIEQETGVTFHRPLFTRDETVDTEISSNQKSLVLYYERIMDNLVKDYPVLKKTDVREEVCKYRMVHIDDRGNILWEEAGNLIVCPEYNYTQALDIFSDLPEDLKSSPTVKAWVEKKYLNVFKEPENAIPEERDMKYHYYRMEALMAVIDENKQALTDTFASKLVAALKPLKNRKRIFTPDTLKTINAAVRAQEPEPKQKS